MKYIIIIFCFPFMLQAQGSIVVDGAYLNVESLTTMRMENTGVMNQNGGQINNTGNLYLGADWTQTGTTTSYNGLGWIWFEGVTNQHISSVSTLSIPKLRVDNGQKLLLDSDVTISTEVDLMNNGHIELGTHNLVINAGALISNYDDNNYIITNSTGYVQQEVGGVDVVFPIGSSMYNPLVLNNSGVVDNFQARVGDIVYSNGTTGTPKTDAIVNCTWYVEEEVVGGADVTLTLQWGAGQELTTFDRTQSIISEWNGSEWSHNGSYSNAIANGSYWIQSRTGLNDFSPFAIEYAAQVLPVEVLNFTSERVDLGKIKLDWLTEREKNNKGFYIERMLANETEFKEVAWVGGNGTMANSNYYDLIDDNTYSGVSYYRLKQVDFDGSINYSIIKAVEGLASKLEATLFPNPTEDFVKIRFGELVTENVTIRIFASDGQLIFQKKIAVTTDEVLVLSETANFPAGAYMLQMLMDDGRQSTKKFIKSRL